MSMHALKPVKRWTVVCVSNKGKFGEKIFLQKASEVRNVILGWIKFPVKIEQKYSILGNLYNFSLHENILIFIAVLE